MDKFYLEHRRKASFGTFFPDSLTKERDLWGQTMAGTDGYWVKRRFVIGDPIAGLNPLTSIIRTVAAEYSAARKKMPYLDTIKLFETMPQVRGTSLELYNYSGRIETISRESVLYVDPSTGGRAAFNRDVGVGFQGIIVRSDEPWSVEQYVMTELMRRRIGYLNAGINMPQLPVHQPWRIRDATELQLIDLADAAWLDYTTEPTPENLNTVISVEKTRYEYVLEAMRWVQFAKKWEHAYRVPFADKSGVIQLWQTDKMQDLNYDETEPWWIESPAVSSARITAIRRAYLTTGRVNITITPQPVLQAYRAARRSATGMPMRVAHHMMTYSNAPLARPAIPNPVAKDRYNIPYVGTPQGGPPWAGNIHVADGWQVLKAESQSMPEPTLDLRSRPQSIPVAEAELFEAALALDKPVLISTPLNGNVAPVLCLPRMFFQVLIVPLFAGGRSIRTTEPDAIVDGWVTDSAGPSSAATQNMFGRIPQGRGFIETAATGRPIREGNIAELLPY